MQRHAGRASSTVATFAVRAHGIFTNGLLKPGLEGFRFPFVVAAAGRGRAVVWGASPAGGSVVVQRRAGRGWNTVATFSTSAHGIFTRTLALAGRPLTRARIGGETSLTWNAP